MSKNIFSLFWDCHKNHVAEYVKTMYRNEAYCDCRLVGANGFSLACHKLVLSSFSSVLKDIIEGYQGGDLLSITLSDVSPSELAAVVDFMYTGETSFPADGTAGFLAVCEMLKIPNFDLQMTDCQAEGNLEKLTYTDTVSDGGDERLVAINDWITANDGMFNETSDFYCKNIELISGGNFTAITPGIKAKKKRPLGEKLLNVKKKYRKIDLKSQPKIPEPSLDDIRDLGVNHVKRYQCKKCGSQYSHKRTLKHHLCWICGQPPTYACEYCSYRGKRKFQLRSHMLHVHQTGKKKTKLRKTTTTAEKKIS